LSLVNQPKRRWSREGGPPSSTTEEEPPPVTTHEEEEKKDRRPKLTICGLEKEIIRQLLFIKH
jgi:hypothetical protein